MTAISTIFGTDGIRSRVGSYPLRPTELIRLGYAIGTWLTQTYQQHNTICIAADHRISSNSIKHNVLSGIAYHNITIIDCGYLTTPALFKLLQHNTQATLGIMISASHNQYHDNGIKLFTKHGKLSEEHEHSITTLFNTTDERVGLSFTTQSYQNVQEPYLDQLLLHTHVSLHNKTIVLDCAHGAASYLAGNAFSRLGAEVIHIGSHPSGFNINKQVGAVHPQRLQAIVQRTHADIGFAFDGDGDRVIIALPDGSIKNGDDILALLQQHPHHNHAQPVIGTLLSNAGLPAYFKQHGIDFIQTDVGDKHIARSMIIHHATLGGEPAGHIIMHEWGPIGDGLYTALKVVETLHTITQWTFPHVIKFAQYVHNIAITQRINLHENPIADIVNYFKPAPEDGKLIVRYSGTEPVLRVHLEHRDTEYIGQLGKQIVDALINIYKHAQMEIT